MRATLPSTPANNLLAMAMLTLSVLALVTAFIGLRGAVDVPFANGRVIPAPVSMPDELQGWPVNGSLRFSIHDATSQSLGELAFTQNLTAKAVDVSNASLGSDVAIRIARPDDSSAFIDSVMIDGAVPYRVDGALETGAAAVRKLSANDLDLLHVPGDSVVVHFHPASDARSLSVVARIPPRVIVGAPFAFPVEDAGRAVTAASSFYTYRWNDRIGAFLDGWSSDPGAPLFKELSQPTTGHPTNFTYGWVWNDRDNLYAALDFTSDNTRDGTDDYGELFVKTPSGVKSFRASEAEGAWGTTDFVYTPRAAYQHHAYRFRIALRDLGLGPLAEGAAVLVAFNTYGTSAFAPDLMMTKTLVTAGPYVQGQTVDYTLAIANLSTTAATSVQVTDSPTNLSIVTVSGGGCAALPCTIPTIPGLGNVNISVTATIVAAGVFDNGATATEAEADANPSNNSDPSGNGASAAAAAAASQIPTLSFWMLALLGVVLGLLGVRRLGGGM